MSVLNSIMDLQNQTVYNQLGTERKPGGEMGKNDFLLLLSAQLKYQDPLEPKSDSDFAAGLAQFTSLEQMQNMNTTLEAMNTNQSYSLIGKYVIAEAVVDGKMGEIPGVVDSIFVKNGVTMAQIGEYVVPVSSIKEVFNTDNILTSEMLLTASNNLIGRTVIAEVNGEDIEGVVTRVLVEKGSLLAQIDDGTDEPKFVPVNSIVDIRETGSKKFTPKPETPPDAINFKPDGKGNFIEICEDFEKELGLWTWDEEQWKWVFTSYTEDPKDEAVNNPGDDSTEDPEPGQPQAA